MVGMLTALPKMPVDKIIAGYRNLLKKFFSPRLYFKRCMTLLEEKPRNKRFSTKLSKMEIRVFLPPSSGRPFPVTTSGIFFFL
jgi:hypothetical protein